MELKVITVNVRGMKDSGKRAAIFLSLIALDFHVCFLQECHLKDSGDCKKFMKEWKHGPSFWNIGNVHSDGVGILFKGQDCQIQERMIVVPGRVMYVDGIVRGEKFRFINMYAPTGKSERLEVFKKIPDILATNRKIVFGGDFNTAIDDLNRDHINVKDFSASYLKKVTGDFELVDGYREVNKMDAGYTWRNTRGVNKRLDYLFVKKGTIIGIHKIMPNWYSDHDMVYMGFEFEGLDIGKGYWKFNNSILESEEFRKKFIVQYEMWREFKYGFLNISAWWEYVKMEIAGFCQQFGKQLKRMEKFEINRLQNNLQRLHSKLNEGKDVNIEEYEGIKKDLKEKMEGKVKSFMFRANVEKKEKDEKCSKYFFQSVRENQKKNYISEFLGENGIVKGKEGLLKHAQEYYRDLFKKRGIDKGKGEIFLNNIKKKLNSVERKDLEKEITKEEIKNALISLKNGKAPGCDGISKEFYQCFWEIIGDDMVEVFKEILKKGVLPESMKMGIISLLFKKGEKELLKNWRPVTLLCTDNKILSKVLTNRLKCVMPNLINEDQTCGVTGRNSGLNLQLIRDTVNWATERDLPLCLMSLDQEKAFDRVNHDFLFKVMGEMNMGDTFMGWVKTMYNGVFSKVKVNGHLSGRIKQEGGVRQGCPMSPLLYVVFIEPFAELVRNDICIEGMHIPGSNGQKLKIAQYADDTTLVLTTDCDIDRAIQLCELYSDATGSKINLSKSSVMYWGKWAGRKDIKGGLSVCEDGIKILGVKFYKKDGARKNWEEKIEKAKNRLNRWKCRYLSISGKVMVIKADMLPSLIYLANVYPIPVRCKIKLTRAVFSFIWGGRYERVKREIMYGKVEDGGRGVICLPLKMDCFFVSNLCGNVLKRVEHKCYYFLRLWMGSFMRKMVPWDNTLPTAQEKPKEYEHAMSFLKVHSKVFEKDVLLNHRKMYCLIREGMGVKVEVTLRFVEWGKIQPKWMGNEVKDLVWLSALNRLPVREVLHRHGCARTAECPREKCKKPETVLHVFWECIFAQKFWVKCFEVLERFIPINNIDGNSILYGVGLETLPADSFLIVWGLFCLGKQVLWEKRNITVIKENDCTTVFEAYLGWIWKVKNEIKMERYMYGIEKCEKKYKNLLHVLKF